VVGHYLSLEVGGALTNRFAMETPFHLGKIQAVAFAHSKGSFHLNRGGSCMCHLWRKGLNGVERIEWQGETNAILYVEGFSFQRNRN